MKKLKTAVFFASIAITVIGFFNQKFIVETRDSALIFVVLSFACPIGVCLIGYIALRQSPAQWPSKIWIWVYTFYLLTYVGFQFIKIYMHSLKGEDVYFRPFYHTSFNSPLPLLLLYFIFIRVSGKPADERNILP